MYPRNVLCGEGLVVHKEELDISDIADQKSFVTGWHHVACLLVGSETNLQFSISAGPCTGISIVKLVPEKSPFKNIPSCATIFHLKEFERTDGITI